MITERISPRQMRWILLLVLILMWELAFHLGGFSRTVLVPPSEILLTAWQVAKKGELQVHFLRTFQELMTSFILATFIGVPFGVLLWRVPYLSKISEPYLSALYSVPLASFYPLLLVLFGLGPTPIILIATSMAVVPIILNTRVGLQEVHEVYLKLGRLYRCTRAQLYRKILFPAAAPYIFAGLKMGFVYALIGSVAMEFILADVGIGFAVSFAYNFFETGEMYVYIGLIIGLAILLNVMLTWGEERVRRYSGE